MVQYMRTLMEELDEAQIEINNRENKNCNTVNENTAFDLATVCACSDVADILIKNMDHVLPSR